MPLPFLSLCKLTVEELSKVKRDLEAALKDVLHAVKINQESGDGLVPSGKKLPNVSVCSNKSDCLTVFLITLRRKKFRSNFVYSTKIFWHYIVCTFNLLNFDSFPL